MVEATACPAAALPEEPTEDRTDSEQTNEKGEGLWKYPAGFYVMLFGCLLPATSLAACLMTCGDQLVHLLLKHPLETLAESAFLIAAPLSNIAGWLAYCRREKSVPIQIAMMNGAAFGTALIAFAVSTALVSFNFAYSPLAVSAVSLGACLASAYISFKLRELSETRLSRSRKLLYAGCGALISLCAFVGAEAKSTFIRANEYLALVGNSHEQRDAITRLRTLSENPLLGWLTCEQDLRMQCANESCAGLSGLFFKISPRRERELYFTVTGKTYGNSFTDSVYAMSDDYLRRNVVGDACPSLSLVRSAITGNIDSHSLAGTVEWTMVLKNTNLSGQEARAEIAVPPGAAVSSLTLWSQGQPVKGNVGGFGGSYSWSNTSVADPASIVDLGRGRVLLKCASVPGQEELKVQLAITERGKADSPTEQTYLLPQLVAANFSLDGHHELRVHADSEMTVGLATAKQVRTADGNWLAQCSLAEDNLHGAPITVHVKTADRLGAVAVADTVSGQGGFLLQEITAKHADVPDQLVIVLDGSKSMKTEFPKIKRALENMPSAIDASIVVATSGRDLDPQPLKSVLGKLTSDDFVGGQDNLEAVTRAAEVAGETKHGAVLWIHGPQPSFNEELYIMAPYISKPTFFELALDNGFTDTARFFRNHQEIGPFRAVPRSEDVGGDLAACLQHWRPDSLQYEVALCHRPDLPSQAKLVSGDGAREIQLLYGRDNCYEMLRRHADGNAAALASRLGIVTPVTSAAVSASVVASAAGSSENIQDGNVVTDGAEHSDNWIAKLNPQNWLRPSLSESFSSVVAQLNSLNSYSSSGSAAAGPGGNVYLQRPNAPNLTGATNGTIGPQPADATLIAGVNTAGTVRVNNLANLEALLNICANGSELLGVLCGLLLLISGAVLGKPMSWPFRLSPVQKAVFGAVLIAAGLVVPGCINWLVASARDANLFS